MPVCMKLLMDQRKITKLLTECANSPLPVEVRQLRINPSGGGGSGAPASSGSSYGGKDAAGAVGGERSTYDVPVEICGIIYMYNPPDSAKLGIETAEGAPADGAAAAPVEAAPADAPAADDAAPADGAAPAPPVEGGAVPADGAVPPEERRLWMAAPPPDAAGAAAPGG